MPETFAYDVPTNTITVTDGTEGAPATFNDMFIADGVGGWGVVSEVVIDAMYKIDCHIIFGDGSTSTYFQMYNENVYSDYTIRVRVNATFVVGKEGSASDTPGFGAYLRMKAGGASPYFGHGGIIKVYNAVIYFTTTTLIFLTGEVYIYNSIFTADSVRQRALVVSATISNGVLDNVYFYNLIYPSIRSTSVSQNRVTSDNCHRGTRALSLDSTMVGLLVTGAVIEVATNSANLTLIDPRFNISTILVETTDNWIKEQYTCNIHIADKDGADLAGVNVDCEYAHLVEGSDSKTYKCIQDHTAVDADHKPITGTDWADYWELYDTSGGLGGDWDTGFAYKAGAEEFATATTDANGDMAEQIIQYKKWAGMSEILEARIHKFTFSHVNYPDFVMNDIIVDNPLVWEFDMGQSTSDIKTIIVEALNVDTYAEPGQETPPATTTLVKKVGYLYKFLRNKLTNDGSNIEVYNDAENIVDQKASVNESAGTVTRGEFGTGP